MSNSENLLLSEKDLNSMGSSTSFIKFAVRRSPLQDRHALPATSCHGASNSGEDGKRKQRNKRNLEEDVEEKENMCGIGKLPSGGESKPDRDSVDENDDGFKTPTSLDQKIPAVPSCPPPPPRKPKASASMKRRAPPRRRVLLDLSNEIELLFPPAVLADLGNTVKKIRQANRKAPEDQELQRSKYK